MPYHGNQPLAVLSRAQAGGGSLVLCLCSHGLPPPTGHTWSTRILQMQNCTPFPFLLLLIQNKYNREKVTISRGNIPPTAFSAHYGVIPSNNLHVKYLYKWVL